MTNQSRQNVSTIGPYRLLKLVGFGPISRLYLAQREAGSPELLALKLIETTQRIFQQEHRQIFFSQEVDRFMRLNHRSLLPLQDAGIYEGYPYLVYPYIKSGSLNDYLAFHQEPKLALDDALVLIYQLGKALEVAHQAQIIHGNIKPGNVFLVMKGAQTPADIHLTRSVAALADFTIDALTRGMRTARLQSTIAARYMAPEQFWGALTQWSDQYSLACLAYELLVGKPVFPARDFHTLEKMHAHHPPIPPGQLVRDLPPEIERALLQALSKRVGDRYPDMQTFLTALAAPSVVYEGAPANYHDPAHTPETGPLIIPTNKLILPLLSIGGEPKAEASQITQSVEAIHISHDTKAARRQQAQESRWLWLATRLKTLGYYTLVFCSQLIMWCGELWSILLLLLLALRNRGKLWQKMQESNARIPAIRPQAPTSLWQTTLSTSWYQGIARNRRRWKNVFNPARPRQRKSRRLTLLIVSTLLGASLCLSGTLLSFTLIGNRSAQRQLAGQVMFGNITSLETTPQQALTIAAQQAPTATPLPHTPTPTLAPTPTRKPTPTRVPTLAPTPTRVPTPTPVLLAYTCNVHYRLVTQWPGGFEADFLLQNVSAHPLNGWVLHFSFTAGQHISQGWNGHFSQNGAQITISSLSYNTTIPAHGILNAPPGFLGTWQEENPQPAHFTLNGASCEST